MNALQVRDVLCVFRGEAQVRRGVRVARRLLQPLVRLLLRLQGLVEEGATENRQGKVSRATSQPVVIFLCYRNESKQFLRDHCFPMIHCVAFVAIVFLVSRFSQHKTRFGLFCSNRRAYLKCLSSCRIKDAEKKVKEIQRGKKASLSTNTTPVRSKGLVSTNLLFLLSGFIQSTHASHEPHALSEQLKPSLKSSNSPHFELSVKIST